MHIIGQKPRLEQASRHSKEMAHAARVSVMRSVSSPGCNLERQIGYRTDRHKIHESHESLVGPELAYRADQSPAGYEHGCRIGVDAKD